MVTRPRPQCRISGGQAERRLTAGMVGNGAAGAMAAEIWVNAGEIERIRAAMHEIAGSGLTLSKLPVAASLLGGSSEASTEVDA